MEELVDDLIAMNQSGQVLELCEKYYDTNILMLNNGSVFASSMREAYNKQKGFISSLEDFNVELISKKIENDTSELVFHYRMVGAGSNVMEFTGKHTQKWRNDKIIREEYDSVE